MPEKQLWGPETSKAVENFPISGETVPVSVVAWSKNDMYLVRQRPLAPCSRSESL